MQSIFRRDMCVEKNTYQPANVQIVFIKKQCVRCSRLKVHRVSGDISVKMLRRSILTDSDTGVLRHSRFFYIMKCLLCKGRETALVRWRNYDGGNTCG